MKQPIRVLNLFTIMNRGGAETMVMNYYRKIDRTKVQFDFMVHRQEKGAYDDEIESLGGRIFRVSPIGLTSLFSYQKELKDFFDKHTEYKILHAHMSEMAFFVFREAKKHNIPVRICHAHSFPNFKYESLKEKLKVLPRMCLVKLIRPLVTDRFCCSKEAGEWLFGTSESLVQMKNAIDTSAYIFNKERSQSIKEKFGWKDKIVFGHIGRLIKIKNQSFIIDLFYLYHQKNPSSVLVLIGDGPDREMLKNKVRKMNMLNAVSFLGQRSDVSTILQGIDLFVFPSLYEGLPVSLVEAQAAGIPCIVSDQISFQAHIIDTYYPISLKSPLHEWIDVIDKALKHGKRNTYSLIKEKGFDVVDNASWLCDFYLKKYQQNE